MYACPLRVYDKFTHSLRTIFWHVPLMMPSRWRSRTRRREDETKMSPEIWKTVNYLTKDERQDNGDRR